ncbi:MAG: peptide ABC transporter substrate-binding protein, partial [Nostoc sp.]
MNNKFSRGQIFAGSLLSILLLSACSTPKAESPTTSTPAATNSAARDTLRLLYWQAPTILNPHLAQGSK